MTRLLLLIAVLAVTAAPASAAGRDAIMEDCADDSRLQGTYTLAELRDARHNLRSEVAEYTDCADVLRRAELRLVERSEEDAGARTDGAAPAAGGAEPPSPALLAPANPAEQEGLRAARSGGSAPVRIGDQEVRPGSAGFTVGAVRNDMPGSLLGVVISLVLLALGAAGARLLRARGRLREEGTGRP